MHDGLAKFMSSQFSLHHSRATVSNLFFAKLFCLYDYNTFFNERTTVYIRVENSGLSNSTTILDLMTLPTP